MSKIREKNKAKLQEKKNYRCRSNRFGFCILKKIRCDSENTRTLYCYKLKDGIVKWK